MNSGIRNLCTELQIRTVYNIFRFYVCLMLFSHNVHVSLFHNFLSFFVFFIGNKIMFRLKFIFEYISTYKFTQKFYVFFIGESCHFSSAENNRFYFLFSWNYWPRFKRPASGKRIKNQKSKSNRVVVALHTLSNFVIIVNFLQALD